MSVWLDGVCSNQTAAISIYNIKHGKSFISTFGKPTDMGLGDTSFEAGSSLDNSGENSRLETMLKTRNFVEAATKSDHLGPFYAVKEGNRKLQRDSETVDACDGILSNIFKGLLFRFSRSFPVDRVS